MVRVLYLLNRTCICTQALANSNNNNIIIFLTNGHHFTSFFLQKTKRNADIHLLIWTWKQWCALNLITDNTLLWSSPSY